MRRWLAVALLSVAAEAAAAQKANTQAGVDVTVSLQRGACERRCAVYRVTVHGDGRFIYEGQHYVRKGGIVRSRVRPEEVRRLVEQFEQLNFFELKDVYGGDPNDCEQMRPDGPLATTTINLNGRAKTVVHNLGCIGPIASRLTALEEAIDRLANTKRWIK